MKIKTLNDLNIRIKRNASEKDDKNKMPIRIKIAMATCGIASGAQETMDYFISELNRQKIDAIVSQTGCMSYCYAEPTVEVTLPEKEPVVFGFVNSAKAQEIIDRYIVKHELVDGIIPASYKTI